MIKKFLKYIFNLISICRSLMLPEEMRQTFSIETILKENTARENYEHFKEIFKTTVLYRDVWEIRKYAIQNAISNDKQKELFFLEFGVWKGDSTNFFSKYVKKLYAFDSFEGLREDWGGSKFGKGHFNLNKQIPKLNSNIEPIVGFVQDTLDDFLKNIILK